MTAARGATTAVTPVMTGAGAMNLETVDAPTAAITAITRETAVTTVANTVIGTTSTVTGLPRSRTHAMTTGAAGTALAVRRATAGAAIEKAARTGAGTKTVIVIDRAIPAGVIETVGVAMISRATTAGDGG
jgi:hypothetical protein